jgi:hypothetical protein
MFALHHRGAMFTDAVMTTASFPGEQQTSLLAGDSSHEFDESAPHPSTAGSAGHPAHPLADRGPWARTSRRGDGSATPNGDSWFLPHSQIDASVTLNMSSDLSVQLQGLNLNNAVFGFYTGNSDAQFSTQREYYGRSVLLAVKYGFGAIPGTR